MAMGNGFDEWGGYMDAKITKLEEQYEAASNPFRKSNLFSGISIFVNGRTDPSADELKRLMMTYGGTYHHYERKCTTYIVAENLPDVKVRQMQHAKKQIIKAQYFVDCIKENRILDYTNYLLYTNQKSTQPSLMFASDKVEVAKNANDQNFISEFYNNSRLHHIATLATELKQYVTDLRSSDDCQAANRAQLRQKLLELGAQPNELLNHKYIMHIDIDCFFVSVGLLKHPELRGQPVAVTHSTGGATVPMRSGVDRAKEMSLYFERSEQKVRSGKVDENFSKSLSLSEIASCSYEARKCGVRNGMFVGKALQLCPNLKTIPYDFDAYKQVAYQLYDTMLQYTMDIEPVSCDEMYVDLTELVNDIKACPMDIISIIRKQVHELSGCSCSAGVGPNK